MTWTAGQLVNQLRHLDPSCEVFVLGTDEVDRIRGLRIHRRRRRLPMAVARRITRTRVVRVTDDHRFAYLEVNP